MEDAKQKLQQQQWDMMLTIVADLTKRFKRTLKGGEDNDGEPPFITASTPGNESRAKIFIMGNLGEQTHSYETVAYLDAHRVGITVYMRTRSVIYNDS
eukprot:14478540-Ditylum_brightwellii.AAC.1